MIDTTLKAPQLSEALGGNLKQRLEGDKEIHIKVKHGEKPEVTFIGFWNGKMINAASNAIARAYRHQRYKSNKPVEVQTKGV